MLDVCFSACINKMVFSPRTWPYCFVFKTLNLTISLRRQIQSPSHLARVPSRTVCPPSLLTGIHTDFQGHFILFSPCCSLPPSPFFPPFMSPSPLWLPENTYTFLRKLHFPLMYLRKGMPSAGLSELCGNEDLFLFLQPFHEHLWVQVRKMRKVRQWCGGILLSFKGLYIGSIWKIWCV